MNNTVVKNEGEFDTDMDMEPGDCLSVHELLIHWSNKYVGKIEDEASRYFNVGLTLETIYNETYEYARFRVSEEDLDVNWCTQYNFMRNVWPQFLAAHPGLTHFSIEWLGISTRSKGYTRKKVLGGHLCISWLSVLSQPVSNNIFLTPLCAGQGTDAKNRYEEMPPQRMHRPN